MRKKWLLSMIAVLSIVILAACSDDANEASQSEPEEEQSENSQNDNDESAEENDEEDQDTKAASEIGLDDLSPIPTDVEGLAQQTSGPFAGDESIYDLEQEVKEEFEQLGPMSDNPTDEEYETYLRFMYWLVAENYPNPQDTIKKWEFASFGNPDLPDERYHFKENYNIEVILDASGSMAADAGGKTRMNLAKESIDEFLAQAPEEVNVSLRVYGHKGTGADSDKEMSCGAIEQVYGFDSYQEEDFQDALGQFDPKGWTPLADALKQSEDALKKFDAENNTNLIYVVSDGIETCGGDPVEVAESMSESNAQPIINIIGFQTDAEAQKQLEQMADVSGGVFAKADDQEQLQEEFERAEEVLEAWEDWKDDALQDVDAMEVDNSFDIMGLHNDWSFTTLGTSNNLNRLGNVMEDIDIITFEQKEELQSRRRAVIDEIDETVDELEVTLEEISEQNINEARKSVNERFENNTANDEKSE